MTLLTATFSFDSKISLHDKNLCAAVFELKHIQHHRKYLCLGLAPRLRNLSHLPQLRGFNDWSNNWSNQLIWKIVFSPEICVTGETKSQGLMHEVRHVKCVFLAEGRYLSAAAMILAEAARRAQPALTLPPHIPHPVLSDTIHIPEPAPQSIPGSASLALDGISSSFSCSYQIKANCKLSFQPGACSGRNQVILTLRKLVKKN